LADVIDFRITRVRRVHYVYRGVPDTDFGPLELAFGDRVVLLDNAADGEALRVRRQAWEDPFAEPLSGENRAFVEESGKWTAFDRPEASIRPCQSLGVVSTGMAASFF
jgi:hypothetical protein